MSEAALEATCVPLDAAEAMVACLELAMQACPQVAHNVTADVRAGADLLWGSLQALMRSVDVNLASIEDVAAVEVLSERRSAAAARARWLYELNGA